MSDARAQIEISATTSQLSSGLRRAASMMDGFASRVQNGVKKAMNVGSSVKGSFVGNIGADLAGRGLDIVTSQAEQVYSFEDNLQRLQGSSKKTRAEIDATRVAFREASKATGINSGEIAAASREYFDLTSDAAGVNAAMSGFAKVSSATGSNMGDITKAAAAMRLNLGITAEEMESAFSGLVEQGNAGKIGLKDAAGEYVRILPTFKSFANAEGRKGLMQIGAALQVVANDFGTAGEAGTALDQMMLLFTKRQAQMKKAGVRVFNKDGSKRDLLEIVADVKKKLPDERKWSKIFGDDAQALRALKALTQNLDKVKEINAAGQETNAIQRDFAARAESTAGKIQISMNAAKEAVAQVFTPERIAAFANAISSLADKLPGIVDKLGKVADVAGKIPGIAHDMGKGIRGLFTDDLPYTDQRDFAMGMKGKSLLGPKSSFQMAKMTPAERKARELLEKLSPEGQTTAIAHARQRALDRASGNRAARLIVGGEKNDQVTDESVRRAVKASVSQDAGFRRAGEAYLENAQVTPEKQQQMLNEIFAAQWDNAPGLQRLADAILAGVNKVGAPEVVIGNEPVAKAVPKSRDHLRKPAR